MCDNTVCSHQLELMRRDLLAEFEGRIAAFSAPAPAAEVAPVEVIEVAAAVEAEAVAEVAEAAIEAVAEIAETALEIAGDAIEESVEAVVEESDSGEVEIESEPASVGSSSGGGEAEENRSDIPPKREHFLHRRIGAAK